MTHTYGLATRMVHGSKQARILGSVSVPLFETASFAMADFHEHESVESKLSSAPYYSRGYNPTVRHLEEKLSAIEGAEESLAFNNGMSAITTATLSLLRDGGHILVSDNVFATSTLWFGEDLPAMGGQATFADFSDFDALRAALQPNTRAIFFEEFTNPLLNVLDLERLVDIAHQAGVLVIVDNTFASPALLRPLEYGADLVVHSATKYMSGHGRVLAGALSGSRSLIDEIGELRRRMGTIATPHNATAIIDGLKTLELRVERASQSALGLSTIAHDHPATDRVNYPGLPDAPGFELATKLTGGRYGGMFSFSLKDSTRKARVYDAFELITRATSLGDVHSLVDPVDNPDVLRISTGIESFDDLAADLTTALDAAL